MKRIKYIILALIMSSCETENDSNTPNTGQGGSLAQFTIAGNYLYTVDKNYLNVFNLINPDAPVRVNRDFIGFDIETLISENDFLYIGSQNGMFIYSLSNPEAPRELAAVSHFRACDPVIANNTHAFVTLDGSAGCGNTISALEIYDITEITNPVLVSSRTLTAPKGLGLFNNYLFVCDDDVKIFDITNPEESVLVKAINISAFDVIIRENQLFIIGENNLYQYQLDETDIDNIVPLSVINI